MRWGVGGGGGGGGAVFYLSAVLMCSGIKHFKLCDTAYLVYSLSVPFSSVLYLKDDDHGEEEINSRHDG